MVMEIGRLVMKIAGRDGGKVGVIVDIINDNYVLIDGQVRRRKCNIKHIEPLDKILKISKNASHDEVKEELKKINIEVIDAKPKEKKERPKAVKHVKKEVEENKEIKVKVKKEIKSN